MNLKTYHVIGLMSGTSLDGIDLVYVKFNHHFISDFTIINAVTIPYSKKWKEVLQNAILLSKEELEKLDISYGELLGNEISNFIQKFNIKYVDFIASHGHTVKHQPTEGITLQIGSGSVLSSFTNQKVICDFRSQDVALGGQGAPLVPIGDQLLFSDYDFCLNLGGFSNISFSKDEKRIAFDICPVNIVLNHYVQKLGFEYDNDGEIARNSLLHQPLLDALNALRFYTLKAPKSLGLEWVQSNVFPIINSYELKIEIILRTFVEHIAIQIGNVIKDNNSVLITGGGAFNSFLIERISFHANVSLRLPDKQLIDYKEALIFAFLGLLRLQNKINCLQSVTGASKNHSSGVIYSTNNKSFKS